MPRAIWTGSISFGLVNIPVKLFTATKDRTLHFHQIHEKTKCRIRQKLYCPGLTDDVPRDEIVKGFEVEPDRYVILKPEEFEAVKPEASHTLDIENFVDLASIDPIYFDKPYYLLPDERSQKPYKLLVTAMTRAGKVGVAKFVMRDKEYLAALRPVNDVICLELMRFADEVVSADTLVGERKEIDMGEKELKMAEQLIESLSEDFDPAKYRDEYRERLEEIINKKAHGEEITIQAPEPEAGGKVIDLMAALEASLAKAKARSKQEREEKPQKKAKRNRSSSA
jgi:DNA end-binding protein Ku